MSKEGLCVKPEKDTIIPMVSEANQFGIISYLIKS